MSFEPELQRVLDGATLAQAEARALMQRILAGEASDAELAAFLRTLAERGETAAEIAGFAEAMRAAAKPLPLKDEERTELVDTCGTGGDASGTFNISTAAALVAVAAGAKVAKHGNRAVTSRCGSADVLEALGIPTDLEGEAAAEALRKHGFCFLHAPLHHPGMKAVMPVRRALGIRTVFNVLGPLLNPAGARRQVMGVYAARLVSVVAQAMALMGTRHAFVVHGDSSQDELALSGPSEIAEVRDGSVGSKLLTPEEFGLTRAPLESLAGGDAQANAAILRAIFHGERGPRREIVLLNAAAVLVVAGKAETMQHGLARATEAIDSGRAADLVETLRHC